MCLLQWILTVGAICVNAGLGAWVLTLEGEWKAVSLVFLIPAFTGASLACAPRGSRIACVASVVVIMLGTAKVLFAVVAAVFASEAAKRTSSLSGLGEVVFILLAVFAGASAVSDLIVGCSAYGRWRARRKHKSLEREVEFTYA